LYSNELLGIFKTNGINLGDKIEISSKEIKVEGELMPKTEVGEPNAIVLKLDNGYNIGISYSKDMKIKRLAAGTGTKFQKTNATSKPGLPKVTILYTGGTIGSKIDYKTGGVHMLLDPSELLYEVPELSEIANIELKQLFSIASEDMSYIEWEAIAKEVATALNKGSKGVVITMGTDTMHYTAAALSFMLKNLNAPVVITGSQRSSDRGSSDAFFNLICSVKFATASDVAEVGTCMHYTSSDDKCAFIRGTKTRKMHSSRRDAFRPINDKPIATIDKKMDIQYLSDYNKVVPELDKPVKADTKFEYRVALVKVYPNSDPDIIEFYSKKGYKGIILEGTGLGHLPTSTNHNNFLWKDHVKTAIEKGMIIGITTQCLYGRVNENVYRNLRTIRNLGAVYCNDMMPETAYVKLGWLLGNYKKDEAEKLLNRNIVGEIKKRTRFDEFLD
jgi:glutamyl-tRNA(Gln) amidotransferase subunit D